MTQKSSYSDEFFENRSGSYTSAQHIVPIIMDLVQPKSVVDVGCGTAEFLSVFNEKGVKEILGVDGKWVDPEKLRIPKEHFLGADLEKPLHVDRIFDLVVSLEVAEHLYEKSAKTFIESLTRLGPVVLFSAAIPFQGGVHHVNEQWPDYWVKLFESKGYVVIDCIRKKIWNNDSVSVWYAQSTFLFATHDYIAKNKKLKKALEEVKDAPLLIVHPRFYLPKAKALNSMTKFMFAPSLMRWVLRKFKMI